MSGVAVTTDRARDVLFSDSYLDETFAFVVPDDQRERYASWDAIRDRGPLTIAVPTCRTTSSSCARLLPRAVIQVHSASRRCSTGSAGHADALALPAERGSAWTLMYPAYSVVVPGPDPIRVPLAYPIGKRDERAGALRQHLDRVEAQGRHARRGVQALDSRAGRRAAAAALVDRPQRPALGGVTSMTEQPRASGVERFLNLFTEVRPGEARTALLLALNVFLILMAYYILKTVREALILGEGTAELKSYLSAGQVVVLAFVVPYYGRLVATFPRMKLINVVTVFFVVCPLVFYVLAQVGVPLGMIFFVWIGIFNLMIVAQFWSFANDVYSKEEGERLLVIVGLGASLGAVAGARVADRLIEPFGVLQLMLLGAGVLGLQLLLTNYIDRVERGRRPPGRRRRRSSAAPAANAFAMVFQTRYLLLMALMLMMATGSTRPGSTSSAAS